MQSHWLSQVESERLLCADKNLYYLNSLSFHDCSFLGGGQWEITTDPISWVNELRTVPSRPQPGTISRQTTCSQSHTSRQNNWEETRLKTLNSMMKDKPKVPWDCETCIGLIWGASHSWLVWGPTDRYQLTCIKLHVESWGKTLLTLRRWSCYPDTIKG